MKPDDYLLHLHGKSLADNLDFGTREPMCIVRLARRPSMLLRCHKVEVYPRPESRLVFGPHYHEPVPGTNGRVVCTVKAEACKLAAIVGPNQVAEFVEAGAYEDLDGCGG